MTDIEENIFNADHLHKSDKHVEVAKTCFIHSSDSVENRADIEPVTKKIRSDVAINSTVHSSPKKRLNFFLRKANDNNNAKTVYRYGNYTRYYGYRNTKDFKDSRLDIFASHKDSLFAGKEILDVGCNIGLLSMSIARDFQIKHLIGLDIDKALINQARRFIQKKRKESTETDRSKFPFNLTFMHGNYIPRDEKLLKVRERHQFDLLLCLSVTKWIHLNFGDTGLKLAFKRMYRQLRPGGKLILEPQPWNSYKRRKTLTPEIAANFKRIAFHPAEFSDYLLSAEVGFTSMYELERVKHDAKGFQRPLQVFIK